MKMIQQMSECRDYYELTRDYGKPWGFKRYHAWLWEFVRVPLLESWTLSRRRGGPTPNVRVMEFILILFLMYPYIVIVCIYSIYTYYIIVYTQICQMIFTYHFLLWLLYEHGHGCTAYHKPFLFDNLIRRLNFEKQDWNHRFPLGESCFFFIDGSLMVFKLNLPQGSIWNFPWTMGEVLI